MKGRENKRRSNNFRLFQRKDLRHRQRANHRQRGRVNMARSITGIRRNLWVSLDQPEMSRDQNQDQEDLDSDVKPLGCSHADVMKPFVSFEEVPHQQQDLSSTLDKDDAPEPLHIKEEQAELCISREGEQLIGLEEARISRLIFTPVPGKRDQDDEEELQSSQPQHAEQTKTHRHYFGRQEPVKSSDSVIHIKTESDPKTDVRKGEQCAWTSGVYQDYVPQPSHIKEDQEELWTSQQGRAGRPESSKTSDPGSLYKTSPSSEPESDDSWDWEDTRNLEPRPKPSDEDETPSQGGRPFSCSFCGKRYPRRNSLKDHMRLHTEGKRFSCTLCHKTFQWRGGLERHKRIHTGEKPFCCYFCDLSFAQNSSLTSHLRVHTGEKPFRCKICKASFRVSCNLAKHMRLHSGKKPFSCTVCAKTFARRGTLRRHATIHTGVKPFGCSVCAKKFTRQGTLRRHTTVHTGVEPFSCSVCGKTFTRRGTLRRHSTVHTGVKPFNCSVCSKSFARPENLKRHLSVHEAEKSSLLTITNTQ